MSKRIEWVDTLRGVGILTVIVAHCGRTPYPIIFAAYIFHVPLFFLLSGYLFSANKAFGDFLKNKIRWLFIPYVVLALGIVLFTMLWSGIDSGLAMAVSLLVQRRRTTLWFLATLFLASILFYWIVRLCKDNKKLVLVISCLVAMVGYIYSVLGGPILPWNFEGALIAILFMSVGYVAKDIVNTAISQRGHRRILLGAGSILVGFALAWINMRICGEYLSMGNGRYGIFPITASASIAMTFGIALVVSFVKVKPLTYLGRNSLVYFAWHQSISQVAISAVLTYFQAELLLGRWGYLIFEVIGIIAITALLDALSCVTRIKRIIQRG